MKLEKTVRKETGYVALAVLACGLVMQAIFFACGAYSYKVFLGSLYGGLVAVGNFLLLGITVQNTVATEDEAEAKRKIRVSYHLRLIGLLILAGIGAFIPIFDTLAILLSLVFPRIYYLFVPLFRKELRDSKRKVE